MSGRLAVAGKAGGAQPSERPMITGAPAAFGARKSTTPKVENKEPLGSPPRMEVKPRLPSLAPTAHRSRGDDGRLRQGWKAFAGATWKSLDVDLYTPSVYIYLGGIETMSESKMLRLPGDSHKTLKILAAAAGKTMTEFVAEMIENAKKSLFPFNIPTRDFTDDEVRKLIADDDKYSAENPKLLKWAHDFGKAPKK